MEVTNQDITDLVTATVKDLGGNANNVELSGNNILVGTVPISIDTIRTCRNSTKAFLSLIKRALGI